MKISKDHKRNSITQIARISMLVIVLLLTAADTSLAHPHVFIDQHVKIVFDDKGLAGFTIQWKFDDMFTSMIVGDFDKNKNGDFDENEVAKIKKEAFSYVSEYNYFAFIKIDGKKFNVKFIKDFSARLIEKNKMVYEFFIPCHVSAINNFKQVVIASYDPTYYTAIMFNDTNTWFSSEIAVFDVKTIIKEDKSTSIYYGQVHPWALFIDFRNIQ